MRELMARLPLLPVNASLDVDFAAADSKLLVEIAEGAEMMMGATHNGIGAIGHLLANSAVMIEDGTIGADSLEALGYLMGELGDLAACCMTLAAQCRRGTFSRAPPTHID